jgi:spoIIIJ-associated protein
MNIREEATQVLKKLLDLSGFASEIEASEDDERVLLVIKGPDTGAIIGKKGQTLDAYQHLVNKIVSGKLPRGADDERVGKAIHLDSEGYRDRRQEALVELAHRLAEKAKKTGRPVEADPMSAADRRIIHVTLAEMKGIATHSEGDGIHRHLVVVPVDSAE